MYEEKVILRNEIGLHARPASVFIREAVRHPCEINIVKDQRNYNAKSIMSVLSMSANKGDEILIQAQGEGEEKAVKALVDLIENILVDL